MIQSKLNVGFVGLGLMGLPMARNLLDAGAQLTVFNRTSSKCATLETLGASVAESPAELARQVGTGIIILCVGDTPAAEASICGAGGILEGLAPGALVIDMGSTEVGATRELAEKVTLAGGSFVDAPVSGGEVGAKSGSLSFMAGGAESDIARARPVFDILGKALTHIGPVSTGQVAKAANQIIVGTTVSIISESFVLAAAAGADLARVREALLGGFAGSRILELHGQKMIDNQFEPGAKATTQLKDLRQALDLAEGMDLSLPFVTLCRDQWQAMTDAGHGNLDQAGYYEFASSLQPNEDTQEK